MKKFLTIVVVGIILFFFTTAFTKAQDVVKTNPNTAKLLTDTAGVRMIKITLAPGEEMVMHTHPVQMMYCLSGRQLTVNYKSG